jgi:hypothetical protein
VFALIPAAALLLGAVSLQASAVKSEKFEIPFPFEVLHQKTLPAGEYRVEQAMNSDLAVLVNTKTGERVQFVRSTGMHREGKTTLQFADTKDGKELKGIS